MKSKNKLWLVGISLFICLLHILPFYILLTTSFKAADDLSSKWVFPGYLYLDNFTNAWREANLASAFKSNIIVTVISVTLIVLVGSIAAYPLSRFQTRWNKFIYTVFVSALIVPPLTILVPLYKFMVDIGGMNQYWGIILLHITFQLPLTIFLYTGFISTIPRELDEAAMIDGAGRFALFYRILLPLLKPITATVIILSVLRYGMIINSRSSSSKDRIHEQLRLRLPASSELLQATLVGWPQDLLWVHCR